MSVKRITTIIVGGRPVERLCRRIAQRRRLRATVEWLLALDPTGPPVYGHAVVHEPWHVTPTAREFLAEVFGGPAFLRCDAFTAFLLPRDRTPAEVARVVNRRTWAAQSLRSAATPVLVGARQRATYPHLATVTVLESITASWDDAEADAAAAWGAMPR